MRLMEEDRLAETARQRLRKEAEWMRRQPKARGTKSKARVDQFYSLKAQSEKRPRGGSVELVAKVRRRKRVGNKLIAHHREHCTRNTVETHFCQRMCPYFRHYVCLDDHIERLSGVRDSIEAHRCIVLPAFNGDL